MTHRVVGLAVAFAALSGAQQTGTIQGTLLDVAGSSIPNARIEALDQAKQTVARETTSSSDGTFYLRNLVPGTYTVRSEVTGFKTLERTEVKLDANQVLDLGTISMQVGQTSESITVAAEVPWWRPPPLRNHS